MMETCSTPLSAADLARRLGCSMSWLLRCRRALGEQATPHVTVGDDGTWGVSEAGFRLFAEVQNLRRSMDLPLNEALRVVRRFDAEAGLYRDEDGDPREWKRRWETARDEIQALRARIEKQDERVAHERALMATERSWMAWERARWHQLVWQMGRTLSLAVQGESMPPALPAPSRSGGSKLQALLEESRRRRQAPKEAPGRKVSLFDRIFRPASMRRAA